MFANRRQVLGLIAMPFAGSAAQGGEQASKDLPKFSRGINFHHVLNWPAIQTQSSASTYIWPPFADDKYKLHTSDLNFVKALGFDFVRLTVDPGLWIAESVRHEEELERRYLDSVETLLAADLNVIFDLAPVDNHPVYTPELLTSREEPQNFDAYAAMVARAARLMSRTPTGRVALELFNEPPLSGDGGEARWATMQKHLHARARDIAPDLALILTAAQWGDGAALTRLDVSPYAVSNVIYTFHYYDPHLFTHQGTNTGAISYVSGLEWPSTAEQAKQAEAAAEQAITEDKKNLDSEAKAQLSNQIERAFTRLTATLHDGTSVAHDFDAIAAWAQTNRIDPKRVLLGEFGCVLGSRGRPIGESRLRWLSCVRSTAEAHGFGWAYWAFKGFGGMELVDAQGKLHFDLIAPLGLSAP